MPWLFTLIRSVKPEIVLAIRNIEWLNTMDLAAESALIWPSKKLANADEGLFAIESTTPNENEVSTRPATTTLQLIRNSMSTPT